MHRFYTSGQNLNQETLSLRNKEEIHHLKHVLRLKKGSPLTLFNGQNQEASGIILEAANNLVKIKIDSVRTITQQRPHPITLACAIPKKAKFETIVEKVTELGVDEIIPLVTKRTEFHIDESRIIKKMQRYQNVAINAAKQSRRSSIPHIHPVTEFSQFIKNASFKNTLALIPCLIGERKRLVDVFSKKLKRNQRILLQIGPEGDFTPKEVELSIKRGSIPVTLGPTVLKVDTAAICVTALASLLNQGTNGSESS